MKSNSYIFTLFCALAFVVTGCAGVRERGVAGTIADVVSTPFQAVALAAGVVSDGVARLEGKQTNNTEVMLNELRDKKSRYVSEYADLSSQLKIQWDSALKKEVSRLYDENMKLNGQFRANRQYLELLNQEIETFKNHKDKYQLEANRFNEQIRDIANNLEAQRRSTAMAKQQTASYENRHVSDTCTTYSYLYSAGYARNVPLEETVCNPNYQYVQRTVAEHKQYQNEEIVKLNRFEEFAKTETQKAKNKLAQIPKERATRLAALQQEVQKTREKINGLEKQSNQHDQKVQEICHKIVGSKDVYFSFYDKSSKKYQNGMIDVHSPSSCLYSLMQHLP